METLLLMAAVAIYFGIIAILVNEARKHIRHIRRHRKDGF